MNFPHNLPHSEKSHSSYLQKWTNQISERIEINNCVLNSSRRCEWLNNIFIRFVVIGLSNQSRIFLAQTHTHHSFISQKTYLWICFMTQKTYRSLTIIPPNSLKNKLFHDSIFFFINNFFFSVLFSPFFFHALFIFSTFFLFLYFFFKTKWKIWKIKKGKIVILVKP